MRTAATLLTILSERGARKAPVERLYRLLFNPALYLAAYGKIYRNAGATTPGSTAETVDGMNLKRIQAIIEALRSERYRWTPVRRVYIEKPHSTKLRPLGIPSWSDKLLQEVLRMLLEAYYEPQFSRHAHGFRPGRGCHTALQEIQRTWRGTTWLVEGDIAGCFDAIDHETLLAILREQIHDERFIRLIAGLLKAGYLEDWRYHRTYSGTPQGGVLSPLLANIYLDRLDTFVEHHLVPAFTRGTERTGSVAYRRCMEHARYWKRHGDYEQAQAWRRKAQAQPSREPDDPTYRRLRYVRYADDFLLGFAGPKHEADDIKQRLREFLRETLKLDLSEAKTLVTHARSQYAQFLGYEIGTMHCDDRRTQGHRSINGSVELRVPRDVWLEKCRAYQQGNKPIHRTERLHDSVFSILRRYQAEYRGLVEYYQMAHNLAALHSLKWVMEQSLVKTLAHKLRVSVPTVYRRYGVTIETPVGPRKVLQTVIPRNEKPPLVAQWGGISLARRAGSKVSPFNGLPPQIWNNQRTEVVQRLLADTCELCGSHEHVQVHHIRRLKSLQKPGRRQRPDWVILMASRRRKTLVVCHACHMRIHAGRHAAENLKLRASTLESRVR